MDGVGVGRSHTPAHGRHDGRLTDPRRSVAGMAQRLPKLSEPLAHAVAELVQADCPISHDQLTRLVEGANLTAGDPGAGSIGKVKRARSVMQHAVAKDRAAGAKFAFRVLQQFRAAGGFRPDDPNYIGADAFGRVRDAYRASGFELDSDGELHPQLLDNVPQTEQQEVLRTYVRRVQRGATDAALVTGSGKDLLEATARHVLDRSGKSYAGKDFPGTLFHAFEAVGLPTPTGGVIDAVNKQLSRDGTERVAQVLYLLGCAVNGLRNQQGSGHGRAFKATVTDADAKQAVEAMALISEMLLISAEQEQQP